MNKTYEHPYTPFIEEVEKPVRYLGGEYNSVVKDWSRVDSTFCLCFPDIYDIGMSHLGTKILYSILNKADDLLMERCFAPWLDMEEQLRKRELPLLSLESHRPLSDFDVVGFSLQYEMTFTNILTMLDLGGIPLRNEDRTLDDPLIIAGGPTATHAEPMAPFIDVMLVGDAEERLPRLLRHYAELKAAGELSRLEILAELAKEGGVYCPDLYTRSYDEESGFVVVDGVKLPGVPEVVERAFLDDISRYRFPDDSPVAVAEAIFDRMSVEIARGCTEGCRFCQAGMIYRPVRERDPEEVVETVLSALDKGGYDEASITSLSTADYSCVSPLIKTLMSKLRERKVSLGISSLRAYGLSDDLLDEIASVKATGLTFAPEAGTQRMRDVINKNITEDDIFTTCHRVFSKGWKKMKLYFILGLPTETDDDVAGIARMGRQARKIGLEYQKHVSVTVSVSSHVPKPHTPFQWAAMDSLEDIDRKQKILWTLSREWGLKFRRHDMKVSHLEGIIGRGDIRTGDLIQRAWELGARFDSWDEKLDWDAWQQALDEWEAKHDVDRQHFLSTVPTDARLPWDHIDVGLEDGFLLKEYQKSLKNRLSPPCGKPKGAKVHHTNLQDALADERKLVCYHCGIACDLTQMREERLDYLTDLGAYEPPVPMVKNERDRAAERVARGLTPHDFKQGDKHEIRIRYTKLGAVRLQSHLDMVRILPRVLRRSGLPVWYSEGFSPKPVMHFGPALNLGASSLEEYVDVALTERFEAQDVLERLNAACPDGLNITGVRVIRPEDDKLSQAMNAVDVLLTIDQETLDTALAGDRERNPQLTDLEHLDARIAALVADPDRELSIVRKNKSRRRRLWDVVVSLESCYSDAYSDVAQIAPGRLAVRVRHWHGRGASLKPYEIFAAVLGEGTHPHDTVRLACLHVDDEGNEVEPLWNEPYDASLIAQASIFDARAMHRGSVRQRNGVVGLIPDEAPSLLALATRSSHC